MKEDEDSKEAASLFDKAGHDRQKFQEWPLCHDSSVSTFQKRWVAVMPEPGEHPFEFGSAVLTIYVHTCKPILAHAAWQRTSSMRNNAGKVLSDILSQWLNVS